MRHINVAWFKNRLVIQILKSIRLGLMSPRPSMKIQFEQGKLPVLILSLHCFFLDFCTFLSTIIRNNDHALLEIESKICSATGK